MIKGRAERFAANWQGSRRTAVIFDGPVGVGKSTLGAVLARAFDGLFLDGDDFSADGKPWYASNLSTSRRIVQATLAAFDTAGIVFIARPVRCLDWCFFRLCFQAEGVRLLVVGLQADLNSIIAPRRGRTLSASEVARADVMIDEGYGAQAFANFCVRTDEHDLAATASMIARRLKGLTTRPAPL